jgi:Domain of unknown function (DUF6249)
MSSALTPDVLKLALILGFSLILLLTWMIGSMVVATRTRRAALELIRGELAQGRSLDPQLVEQLVGPRYPRQRPPGQLGPMPGIMTIALGVGVSLMYAVLHWGLPDQYKGLGSGLILICLGIGLLVSSRYYKLDPQA